MKGTINEFARNQERGIRRRAPQKWTRRINLNPLGTSPSSRRGTGVKRRHLTLTFSAVTFVVGWKPMGPEVVDACYGKNDATRLDSARLVFISE
jgi:hypothetical protein